MVVFVLLCLMVLTAFLLSNFRVISVHTSFLQLNDKNL